MHSLKTQNAPGLLCRKIYALCTLFALLLHSLSATSYAEAEPINGAILAEFVYKAARYTTWPEPKESYHIHVVGLSDTQRQAIRLLSERQLQKKPIKVTFEEENKLPPDRTPEVILISDQSSKNAKFWCEKEMTALIIKIRNTEHSTNYLCENAILTIEAVDGRFEFEANQSAARERRIRLSARMLRLARKIH